jgi:transcriptional regulator of acetoin/glycerol metabolism
LSLAELEKMAIAEAVRASAGNIGKAAKLLGIGRSTLYRRLLELGMESAPGEAEEP